METNTNLLQKLYRKWGYAPLIAILAIFLYLFFALRSNYPVGYAGLFSLMFEGIAENGFIMPESLPFYNIEAIPFAYPPVGFYIAAFITKIFNLSSLTYLRFLPVFLAAACAVTFYYLLHGIVKDHHAAAAGSILFLSMPEIAHYDFSAAGMVRGFALLFLLLFWLFFWRICFNETQQRKDWILAGIFFSLTILTHLSYGIFAGFGFVLMLLFSPQKGIEKLCIVLRLGLMTSLALAPWLIRIFKLWGIEILLAPMGSHSNFEISPWLHYLLRIISLNPPATMALFLIAFLHAIIQKRWIWLFWFLLTVFGVGESNRFLLLILIVMTAEFVVFAFHKIREEEQLSEKGKTLFAYIVILLVVGLAIPNYLTLFRQQKASLTDEFIEMGTWLEENTAEDSQVLFIESDHALSEWLPYFSHRVPETGHWGTEWLGTYNEESEQQFLVRGIAANDNYELLVEGMEHYEWTPDYIVCGTGTTVCEQLLQQNDVISFVNSVYYVLETP